MSQRKMAVKEEFNKKTRVSKKHYVQLGSYQTSFFLQEMVKKCVRAGLRPIINEKEVEGEVVMSLELGPFSKKEAEIQIKDLKEKGLLSTASVVKK